MSVVTHLLVELDTRVKVVEKDAFCKRLSGNIVVVGFFYFEKKKTPTVLICICGQNLVNKLFSLQNEIYRVHLKKEKHEYKILQIWVSPPPPF